ncbi:AfsR/SARP family transcriptional regulator [Catenuloplanes japonicus]|uniref:AfsR/SARP family transcriptional regulator n=1 Tax=Catenuloplanes japonicus TaxID=33876 RepID=UPI000526A7EE|nr:BTAD domain-containing putative transcriptional regulator [Catenuloplanes japonicus]
MIEFSLLGPVQAWHDGRELEIGSPQQRTTLAILLLHEGAPVSLRRFAAALWDDEPPQAAAATVRTYVSRLRHVLQDTPASIESTAYGYALSTPPLSTDLDRFRRHTLRATEATQAGRHTTADLELCSALALHRGAVMAGAFGPYAETQRIRLERLIRDAELARLHAQIRLGDADYTAPEAQMMLAADPDNEALHELLMLALYASGRRAEALAHFHGLRHTTPSPALVTLHRRILADDPALI